MSASLVLGSIYCLSCLVLVFGVREQPGKSVRVQPGGEGGVAEVLWVPKGGNVWSSPHRDVKRQLLAQLSCTRTRRRRPPVPPIAAPATPLSLPRAPQPPGEGWAALHPLPEDDRGTQALHPAALWLPLRLPGLPGARAASAGGELGGGGGDPARCHGSEFGTLRVSPCHLPRSCRGFLLSSVPTLRGWPGNSSIWCSSCW